MAQAEPKVNYKSKTFAQQLAEAVCIARQPALVGHWVESKGKDVKGRTRADAHRFITHFEAEAIVADKHSLPEWLLDAVMRDRGGCRCQDPGASPPCSVCTTPATMEDLEAYIDDPVHECMQRHPFAMASDVPAILAMEERNAGFPGCVHCRQRIGLRHLATCQDYEPLSPAPKVLPNALVVRGGFDRAGDL